MLFRSLLNLKLRAETKVFSSSKELKNNKDIMHLINKSKDPIGELSKLIELLKGNATGRIEVKPEEKKARFNRLKSFMVEN